MKLILSGGILFFSSLLLTGLIRHYALATQLLDIPNARSSHKRPTPRGGGLSFVLLFCTALLSGLSMRLVQPHFTFAIVLGGALVAVLGFIDDRRGLSAKLRLLGHFIAALFALSLINHLLVVQLFNWTISHKALLILFLFFLVWMINLFNFMDGIDGLAASEAVFACGAAILLYSLQNNLSLIYFPLCMALTVAGFLCWNFPPAKIFMGDVGSGFLGFVLGLLALQAAVVNPLYFWCWMILLGVFIVDASYTLIRRAMGGALIWQAHCSHAYQHAAQNYKSHRTVTLGIWFINICWLLPWALLVSEKKMIPFVAIACAYLPLIILVVKFKAGKENSSNFYHKMEIN